MLAVPAISRCTRQDWWRPRGPPVLGTGTTLHPEAGDAQPGNAAVTGHRGGLPAPAQGLSTPAKPPGAAWLRLSSTPARTPACPAQPKFLGKVMRGPGPPRHMALVPQLRRASSSFLGSMGTPWHPPAEWAPAPTLPSQPPHLGAGGLGSAHGRAESLGRCASRSWCASRSRCASRSCRRCHLHTTDSSCSSGTEP